MRRKLASNIDARPLRQLLEPLLQIIAHVAKGDPWRIADDDVRPTAASGKGDRLELITLLLKLHELVECLVGYAPCVEAIFGEF